jgi:signal transduction histidine kinase
MAKKCFMCGREVGEGILCEKCDKPRRKSGATSAAGLGATASDSGASIQSATPEPPPQPRQNTATAPELDPFPKAPILHFPVESASPAVTSVVNLLIASGVASVLLGPDRTVKFVSDDAKKLFDGTQSELAQLSAVEAKAGIRVGDLSVPTSAGVHIGGRNFIYTLVPMSGGATGAVLVFRHADPMNEAHASFVTYVREAVFGPLRALRESLHAASRSRNDALLADSAAVLDQVLSSLEMAPEVEEASYTVRPVPTVTDVVRRVAERFRAHADLKGIRLDIDVQDLEERFSDHDQLAEALTILMENALHYVPAGGQVVIGVRWMEHKGKPLLLFFVMDNGAVVPESLRTKIFEPSFVWNPSSPDRTGRGLFKCREFAVAHAGSVWAESKTGKACTFFLRVRPDGVLA